MRLLDPALAAELVKGHTDIITMEDERTKQFLRGVRCPKCGGATISLVVNQDRPFVTTLVLANRNASCADCNCLFEPYSRVIIKG